MYIRFTTGEIHDKSSYEVGVFQAAYRLRKQGNLADYEETRLRELLDWFNTNLKKPDRIHEVKTPVLQERESSDLLVQRHLN
jgi:hypothetical protein